MQEPLKILTITIGILHFVQEPLIIKAASSIKRGSCFEGIRVCFYGLGQPWFIADSETHRKWTTGSQKHTHTHTFNSFFDNYWSRESREQYYIDLRSFTLEILCFEAFFTVIAPPMVRSPWNFACLLRVIWNMFSPSFVKFWIFVQVLEAFGYKWPGPIFKWAN